MSSVRTFHVTILNITGAVKKMSTFLKFEGGSIKISYCSVIELFTNENHPEVDFFFLVCFQFCQECDTGQELIKKKSNRPKVFPRYSIDENTTH